MGSVINFLSTPWVGTILAILSLGLAFYFYAKAKTVSRLAYQVDEVSVVGGAAAAFPDEVQITFGGVAVPRVTVTNAIIWNAGNTTIRGDQIVESDLLRFEAPEGSCVLRANVVKLSREANGIGLQQDDRAVLIDFDYLDPNDGVSLEIYHSSARRELTCQGTLRGLSGGPLNWGRLGREFDRAMTRRFPAPFPVKSMNIISIFIGGLLLAFGLFRRAIEETFPALKAEVISMDVFFIGLGIFYILAPAFLLWAMRRKHPKALAFTSEADQADRTDEDPST